MQAKESYFNKSCHLEEIKAELDRLRHVDAENCNLRDQMRDMEQRIVSLSGQVVVIGRANTELNKENNALKERCEENGIDMTRFADEIRIMDAEVDRRRQDQEALFAENKSLKERIDELLNFKAELDQSRQQMEDEV